jgi:hypothetical protein
MLRVFQKKEKNLLLYPEAFTSTVKQTVPHCPTAFIINAIFIFNYVVPPFP